MESLPAWLPPLFQGRALFVTIPATAIVTWILWPNRDLPGIPTIVSAKPGLSIISHVKSLYAHDAMVQTGYKKYYNGLFRIPFMGRWTVVLSGDLIEEYARAPDSILSFQEVLNQQLQLEVIMGPTLAKGTTHLAAIRNLTRDLNNVFVYIQDETPYVLSKLIPITEGQEWTEVKGLDTIQEIVARLNDRVFVGLPLCRDEEWNRLSVKGTTDLGIRSMLLTLAPRFLRPAFNSLLSIYKGPIERGKEKLSSLIEERRQMAQEDRPDDMVSWIMQHTPEGESTVKTLAAVLQLINLAAHHTTTLLFTHVLFYLAADPDLVEVLREEISSVVEESGWNRGSVEKLEKMDSAFKEAMRYPGLGPISMNRIAMRDFAFSNGVHIPAGTVVMTVGAPVHYDPAIYPEPEEYKALRFYDLARKEKSGHTSLTDISPELLGFGLGKHACPGRWYVSLIDKYLMAYILINYDIKFPGDGKRPENTTIMGSSIPNTKAKILFRKRTDVTLSL